MEEAKRIGLNTGVIIAPVFPPVKIRSSPVDDLKQIVQILSKIKPDYIYGESLHTRGSNIKEIEAALGERPVLKGFDEEIGDIFYRLLNEYKLDGTWWPDH